MTLLIKRVFFAFEDGRTVFTFQIPMSALFMAGCLITTRLLSPGWWVIGIALSQTLSYTAGVVLRLGSLRYRIGGVDGHRLISLHLRVVAGEAGFLIEGLIPAAGASIPASALAVVLVGVMMALIYGTCLHVMGVEELTDFLRPMMVRLGFAGRPALPPAQHARFR